MDRIGARPILLSLLAGETILLLALTQATGWAVFALTLLLVTVMFADIADLLGVLEHSKLALNVVFFVRHEYFLHPKSRNLQEVSRESVHIYKGAGQLNM